jgi:hypothetical protein
MKHVVILFNDIRLAEHDAESWFDAYQWIDKYNRKNGLRIDSKRIEEPLLYIWVVKA